jgi:putative ribosome biogenesis GTPase RsgA
MIKVIFRKWANGDITALFPEVPSDFFKPYCQSYEHVGQHGSADPYLVINNTTSATQEEYKDLKEELEKIGYKLQVCKRHTWQMRKVLREALQNRA